MSKSIFTLFALFCLSLHVSAARRPNIILVYADDISARELPIYGSSVWSKPTRGDTSNPTHLAKTPVLDRMAREGCWVTTAWASVVCSPSRAMMMTGRYAHLHKWWNNKDKGQYIDQRGKPATWPLYLSSQHQIGHIARQAGYATYWAGKTQMAGDLQEFGFDQGCFTPGNLADTDNPYTDFKLVLKNVSGEKRLLNADSRQPVDTYRQHGWYFYPHVRLMNHDGKHFQWWPNSAGSQQQFGIGTYGPDVELEFIFDFIDRQVAKNKPFFVYHTSHLGHDAFDWLDPHSESSWPGTPVIRWDGEHYSRTEPHITGDRGEYETHGTVTEPGMHKHIEYLDFQMWQYRNKLQQLGIADNTVVIFCADNGSGGYGKNSIDRQKGTHVPLIIYAPGMTKQGKQDVLVNMSDMLPTIAELTGAQIPSDYEINGESLVPFLFTDKPTHRQWIYAYSRGKQIIRGARVMKDGRDKWWDVTSKPDDLISFTQIKDWSTVSQQHRTERDLLNNVLPRFDLHATEHDAPGLESNRNQAKPRRQNRPTQNKNLSKRAKAKTTLIPLETARNTVNISTEAKNKTQAPDLQIEFGKVASHSKFDDPMQSHWGGSVVQGSDGLYHMLYSRWPKELGWAWVTDSEIAHATSQSPFGPYTFQGVALPRRGKQFWDGWCTHNPTVYQFGDKYYLYYMGNTGDGVVTGEPGRESLNWTHRNNQRIGVAVADNPAGPWIRTEEPLIDVSPSAGALDSLMTSNPSVCERPEGGYLMVYKAVGKKYPLPSGGPVVHCIATSDSPTGPFVKHDKPTFTFQGERFPAEDPYIWHQAGKYRAIVKRMKSAGKRRIFSLVQYDSPDGFDWQPSRFHEISDRTITWQDGKTQQLEHLERPQLIIEKGKPIALLCAADTRDENRVRHAFNVQIPLKITLRP